MVRVGVRVVSVRVVGETWHRRIVRWFRERRRQVVRYIGVSRLVTGVCVYSEELCLVVGIVVVGLVIAREADEVR